jgi:hypothetical protein
MKEKGLLHISNYKIISILIVIGIRDLKVRFPIEESGIRCFRSVYCVYLIDRIVVVLSNDRFAYYSLERASLGSKELESSLFSQYSTCVVYQEIEFIS